MKKRIAIICPGRGSYTEKSLGTFSAADPLVQRAETVRAEFDLDPLLDLDGADRFSAVKHLRPANVSALIYLSTMLDVRDVIERENVVAVGGNSMGWYTSLAVAGAPYPRPA